MSGISILPEHKQVVGTETDQGTSILPEPKEVIGGVTDHRISILPEQKISQTKGHSSEGGVGPPRLLVRLVTLFTASVL